MSVIAKTVAAFIAVLAVEAAVLLSYGSHAINRSHCCSSSVESALAEELPADSADAAVDVGDAIEDPAHDDVEAGEDKCVGAAPAAGF